MGNEDIRIRAEKLAASMIDSTPILEKFPGSVDLIKELEAKFLAERAVLELQEGGGELTIFDPPTFKDYIGQFRAKETTQMMISAAKLEKRPLPNILLDGDSGLGKTTLAKLILQRMRVPYKMTDGASASKTDIRLFKDYIFIDEIHNLDAQVCDSLNVLLDRGSLHIIGATTKLGDIPRPFRSRFRHIHLTRYTEDEIAVILRKAVSRKQLHIRRRELLAIAKRSRSTPRVGLTYLANVFEYAVVKKEKIISASTIEKVFEMLGVDEKGLTIRDYEYLEAIPNDRSVGLQYISARISVDDKTIEEEVEPYLMQLGMVDRTNRGRKKITITPISSETDEEKFIRVWEESLRSRS